MTKRIIQRKIDRLMITIAAIGLVSLVITMMMAL